jgi:hypothetical protein
VGYDNSRTEAAEEDKSAAVGEGAGTVGAAEEEVVGGCDEELIAEREEMKCFSLFRALIPS